MYRLNPDKLKQFRLRAGLTLNQAARVAGYKNASTILQAERGLVRVPVHRLVALARLYGVTVEDFCDDCDEDKAPAPAV